ncbi:hypothetical protein J1N35_025207 [Gossypium stocksii]|uniref:Uncharacterized protein n=1 Tax=Gossypium stocksii TaxID=47602 RepID=A0A9D3V5Z9_9ROSI|nr:hypothetical protein J1N35_025207 [Gossypium stocksii]
MGLCYIPSLAHWTSQLFVGFSFRFLKKYETRGWDDNARNKPFTLETSTLRLKQALPMEGEGPSGTLLQLTASAAIGLEEAALSRDKEHSVEVPSVAKICILGSGDVTLMVSVCFVAEGRRQEIISVLNVCSATMPTKNK